MNNSFYIFLLPWIIYLPSIGHPTSHNIIMGITGNYLNMAGKLKMTVSHSQEGNASQIIKLNPDHYSPGALIGYQFQKNKFFYEGIYEYTLDRFKTSKNFQDFTIMVPGIGLRTAMESNAIRFKQRGTHSLSFKYGYQFLETMGIYLKAGLLYTRFNINVETHGYSTTRHQYGFAPGIGIEKMLTQNFSLRFEYNYRLYRRVNVKNLPVRNTAFVATLYECSVKPREHHLGLSLIYKFNLSKDKKAD